jgi:hypothetical protein
MAIPAFCPGRFFRCDLVGAFVSCACRRKGVSITFPETHYWQATMGFPPAFLVAPTLGAGDVPGSLINLAANLLFMRFRMSVMHLRPVREPKGNRKKPNQTGDER